MSTTPDTHRGDRHPPPSPIPVPVLLSILNHCDWAPEPGEPGRYRCFELFASLHAPDSAPAQPVRILQLWPRGARLACRHRPEPGDHALLHIPAAHDSTFSLHARVRSVTPPNPDGTHHALLDFCADPAA